MYDFIDKTSGQKGTKINREALMAVQGFIGKDIVCIDENTFEVTSSKGHKKHISFNKDGTVTEKFIGEKTVTSTLTFLGNGAMRKVIT